MSGNGATDHADTNPLPSTPRQRAIAALECRKPCGPVPTCELAFDLFSEWLGEPIPKSWDISATKGNQRKALLNRFSDAAIHVYREMDHCIITEWGGFDIASELFPHFREKTGDEFLFGFPGDPTFAIPDGTEMEEFIYQFADHPQKKHDEAKRNVESALTHVESLKKAGGDVVWMSSDYAMNSGPFFSPAMFAEFVTPYLKEFITGCREMGLYTIKHSDGNIMPILDQLIDAAPHAIHSIDSVAGVDIRQMKKECHGKVALIGNVPHGPLQMGKFDLIAEAARYCLQHGGVEAGGYIYSTSNAVFGGDLTGISVKAYRFMLEIRDDFMVKHQPTI